MLRKAAECDPTSPIELQHFILDQDNSVIYMADMH